MNTVPEFQSLKALKGLRHSRNYSCYGDSKCSLVETLDPFESAIRVYGVYEHLGRLLYEIPESFPWERKLVKMTYLRVSYFKLIYC